MDVTACYPKVKYRSKSSGSVSNAGMLLLTETARVLGLMEALAVELDGFARRACQRGLTGVCRNSGADIQDRDAPDVDESHSDGSVRHPSRSGGRMRMADGGRVWLLLGDRTADGRRLQPRLAGQRGLQ